MISRNLNSGAIRLDCEPVECLLPGTVDIWFLQSNDAGPDRLGMMRGLLDDEERQRIDGFLFEQDRQLHLLSHGIRRLVLSRYASVRPDSWHFTIDRYGKPEIRDDGWVAGEAARDGRLRFNLSHTEGLVACAVTRTDDVGIDVEAVDRWVDPMMLAQAFFSPAEQDMLAALPSERQRIRCFFTLWTLKEAYVKARGLGLSLPLDRFTFALNPPHATFNPDFNDDEALWQFIVATPTPRHRLSIAVHRPEAQPVQLRWHDLAAEDAAADLMRPMLAAA